jgi:DNA-binding MarR family transcriptional regulator
MRKPDDVGKMLREWMEISTRRSIHNFAIYCRGKGLSLSQLTVLFHLRFKGGGGVSEIAENFGISRAAASQLVERMVQQDLVSRSEDPRDRRAKRIAPTEKALGILKGSNLARQKWVGELVKNLSPAEQDAVRAGVRILIDHAKRQQEQPVPSDSA